ncbi:MAG TPA: LamG domain-containing protein [Kofleriaceae bacterium]|nr:LamG domain-containing protein [Kofleriaceae bacterium]
MVLIPTLRALAIAACLAAGLAGCGQSLFDAHGDRARHDGGGGGDDGGGPDAYIPDKCDAPCIADAASGFIDTSGAVWRYLDDRRNRIWIPMAQSGNAMMSSILANRFARCSLEPTAEACKEMPDALLVTAAGAQSSADPAIEFRSDATQAIQLVFRVHVPASNGVAHRVRLYRHSREDVLVTVTVQPGETQRHAVFADALAGDRFLLALEPLGSPGGTAAMQFFVRGPDASFPATCRLAIPFPSGVSSATIIPNLCGPDLQARTGSMPGVLGIEPGGGVATLGTVGSFEPSNFVQGNQSIERRGATTFQLWIRDDDASEPQMWQFSDADEDTNGGIAIRILGNMPSTQLEVGVPVGAGLPYATQTVPYTNPASWHLLRVVHDSGMVSICIDGKRAGGGPLPGPATTGVLPHLGRHSLNTSVDYFRGAIDDVRVFSTALPCDAP